MSKLNFEGRVALVTGAGRGLGAAYAEALARAGASVVVNDIGMSRDGSRRAEAVATRLSAEGLAVSADTRSVASEDDAAAMVEDTVARFDQIDILVNNAGIGAMGPLHAMQTAEMRAVFDTHVFGTFWTMRAAIPHMRAQGHGRIVNTVSTVGAFSMPEFSAYAGAKAALIAMTRCAAQEHPDVDLCINAFAPVAETAMGKGFFTLNPTLDGSLFEVGKVVPLLTYLCHADCKLTGEMLSAGAGRFARVWTSTAAGLTRPDLTDGEVARLLPVISAKDGEIEPRNALDDFGFVSS